MQTTVPRELAELWAHMCPAQVYEVEPGDGALAEVKVAPSNCVQCGAITAKGGRLTPPEGGSGPEYTLTSVAPDGATLLQCRHVMAIRRVITSVDNPRVKEVVRLRSGRERRRQGLFVAEGPREVERARAAGLNARRDLLRAGARSSGPRATR